MNKCTYCGKDYPDDATVCPLDGQPLSRTGLQSVSQHGSPPSTTSDSVPNIATRAAANRNMLVGGLWCAGGIIVTLATYSAASGGGTYFIAWGAILFGGIQFLRGLLASNNNQAQRFSEENEGVFLAWKCPRCDALRDFCLIATKGNARFDFSGSVTMLDLRCSECRYEFKVAPSEKDLLMQAKEATRLLKKGDMTAESYLTTIQKIPASFVKNIMAITQTWKCPQCGEANPVNFDSCWSCRSKERPESNAQNEEAKPFPGFPRGGNSWE